MNKSIRLLIIIFVLSGAVALLFGLWSHRFFQTQVQPLQVERLTLLEIAKTVPPFKLASTNGTVWTEASLRGRYTLFFFGFSRCSWLCPTTLSVLNKVMQKFSTDETLVKPQIVFISVDPEHDTLPILKYYVKSFNPDFIGLTGRITDLEKLAKFFNVLFMKVVPEHPQNSEDYYMDHSGTLLLVDPHGQFVGIFTTPHEVEPIFADLKQITQQYFHPAT